MLNGTVRSFHLYQEMGMNRGLPITSSTLKVLHPVETRE
jgi:hypothetical protein